MTDEDLGYKLGVVEQAKFQYFQLGKVRNEVLEIEDKKEKPRRTMTKNINTKQKYCLDYELL